jgi:hypothetical protein
MRRSPTWQLLRIAANTSRSLLEYLYMPPYLSYHSGVPSYKISTLRRLWLLPLSRNPHSPKLHTPTHNQYRRRTTPISSYNLRPARKSHPTFPSFILLSIHNPMYLYPRRTLRLSMGLRLLPTTLDTLWEELSGTYSTD